MKTLETQPCGRLGGGGRCARSPAPAARPPGGGRPPSHIIQDAPGSSIVPPPPAAPSLQPPPPPGTVVVFNIHILTLLLDYIIIIISVPLCRSTRESPQDNNCEAHTGDPSYGIQPVDRDLCVPGGSIFGPVQYVAGNVHG